MAPFGGATSGTASGRPSMGGASVGGVGGVAATSMNSTVNTCPRGAAEGRTGRRRRLAHRPTPRWARTETTSASVRGRVAVLRTHRRTRDEVLRTHSSYRFWLAQGNPLTYPRGSLLHGR